MDSSSSLAESQQQQQSQSDQQPVYDSAQAQAYDAYYASYNYYDPSAYQQPAYYPHENPSSSAATATPGGYYTAAQPDAACPPVDAAQIHHSGAHEGAVYASGQDQDGSMNQVPTGLNQAAAAALTQLSQLAGSIEAAERVISGMYERHWHAELHGMVEQQPPPHYHHYAHPLPMPYGAPSIHRGVGGRSPYRSVGRRGSTLPRGRGGRGLIMQHASNKVGGPPPRGRGHGRMGRGGGRQIHQSALDTQQPQSAPAQPSVRNSLLPVAWCDICRVDCNSFEILEQHKNGKRHKKTVQKVQQIQAQQKLIAEMQFKDAAKQDIFIEGEVCKNGNAFEASSSATLVNVGDQIASSMAEGVEVSEGLATSVSLGEAEADIAPSGDNLTFDPTPVLINKQNLETDIHGSQMVEEQSNPSSDTVKFDASLPLEGFGKKRRMTGFDRNDRFRGSKQKVVRFGPGGKYMKSVERPRDRPRVCTVCNVMCDTLAVFECHLAGKKHISHVKRFQGQGSVYGPINVYIPPNQPSTYPNNGPEPVFYGLQGHEILQQSDGLQSQGMLQQEPPFHHSQYLNNHTVQQFYQSEYAKEAIGTVPKTEAEKDLGHTEEVVPLQGQSSANELEARDINHLAPEAAVLSEDSNAFPIGKDVPEPEEYEASIGADVTEPGLDAVAEEPVANSEELQSKEDARASQ